MGLNKNGNLMIELNCFLMGMNKNANFFDGFE